MAIYYVDMDGVLANFHEHEQGWKKSGNYNFIRNLRPFKNAVDLVAELIEKGNEIYISSLCRNDSAKKAKIDWLTEFLPQIDIDHIIIMIGNAKKDENMKTDEGILIDDKKTNVNRWRKAGHKAIFVEEKGVINMELMA